LYERTRDPCDLRDAVSAYRAARDAWAGVVEQTKDVYRPDLTFGDLRSEHGHWADRLPAIEEDLANLERQYDALKSEAGSAEPRTGTSTAGRPGSRPRFSHTQPAPFVRGDDVTVELSPAGGAFEGTVTCHYRHLNQGEDFVTTELRQNGSGLRATVPGSYTDSDFALVYYFTVHTAGGDAWILPGLDETLANQPYHVLRQAR
jgi:hypothetical protein